MREKEFKTEYDKKEDTMIEAILDFAAFSGMVIDIKEIENHEVIMEHIEIDYKKCIIKIK